MPEWHGEWNENSRRYLAAIVTVSVLSTIAFGLRLYSRRLGGIGLWWDDYCAAIALLLSYAPSISTAYAIRYGLGHHKSEVGKANVINTLKIGWIEKVAWQFGLPFVKFSLLFLYRRLFPTKWLHRAAQLIGLIVLGWLIACTVVAVISCTPIAYYWDRTISGGHCLDYNKFYVVSSAINMATDVIVLCLPLPVVWKLQISTNKKIGLSFAFLMGGFACAASIAHMAILPTLNPADITYTAVDVGILACVEVSAGVISCNIPASAPIFILIYRKARGKTTPTPKYSKHSLPTYRRLKYNKFLNHRSGQPGRGVATDSSIGGFTAFNSNYNAQEDTIELTSSPITHVDSQSSESNVVDREQITPPEKIYLVNQTEKSGNLRSDASRWR